MERMDWARQLSINYRTLTVCQHGISNPFNTWAQAHVNQGFSWRPQSVCFATFESASSLPRIEIAMRDSYISPPDALRIIRVPFQVASQGIEITSPLSESWRITLPSGSYSIFFAVEVDPNSSEEDPWLYRLTFVNTPHIVPAEIVRAGDDWNPPDELDMSAEPA